MNTVGKSAFVEAVGRASDDAEGYLDFFKGEIGKTHLAQELWTQIDNGQLAPDLAEIRTSITNVSNEITQTVNKKLEDQSAEIQQIQKVQVDTNNNLNSMWAVKLQQMKDGRLYIAGIGAGIENTPAGMQSQVLARWDTPKVVKGVSFLLRLTVTADDGNHIPLQATGAGALHADGPGGKCVGAAGRSGIGIVPDCGTGSACHY
ncbi:Host specificity protein J [Shigella sonnei]|nr:Host specificity protein J [Shigella sonnei]